MNVTRRSFLRGVLSVSALTVTGLPSLATVPRIVGDGVHDDADGLEALFARQPVSIENEAIVAREGYLSGGRFFVGRPLLLKFDGDWNITVLSLDFGHGHFPSSPAVTIEPGNGDVSIDLLYVQNGSFQGTQFLN